MKIPMHYYVRDHKGNYIGVVAFGFFEETAGLPAELVTNTSFCRQGDAWDRDVGCAKAYGRLSGSPIWISSGGVVVYSNLRDVINMTHLARYKEIEKRISSASFETHTRVVDRLQKLLEEHNARRG